MSKLNFEQFERAGLVNDEKCDYLLQDMDNRYVLLSVKFVLKQ